MKQTDWIVHPSIISHHFFSTYCYLAGLSVTQSAADSAWSNPKNVSFQPVGMSHRCGRETSQNQGEAPDLRRLQTQPGLRSSVEVPLPVFRPSRARKSCSIIAALGFSRERKLVHSPRRLYEAGEMLWWFPNFPECFPVSWDYLEEAVCQVPQSASRTIFHYFSNFNVVANTECTFRSKYRSTICANKLFRIHMYVLFWHDRISSHYFSTCTKISIHSRSPPGDHKLFCVELTRGYSMVLFLPLVQRCAFGG